MSVGMDECSAAQRRSSACKAVTERQRETGNRSAKIISRYLAFVIQSVKEELQFPSLTETKN
jgi:uncharacterized protein YchJ